jgi:hypothetical protein
VNAAEKREIIENTTSNFLVDGKDLGIEPREPFSSLLNRACVTSGALQRDTARTRLPRGASPILRWLKRELEKAETASGTGVMRS